MADRRGLFLRQVGNHSLIVQRDGPIANAGIIYVQNVRAGDAASWVLQELTRRMHLFLFHPEAVKRCRAE